LGGTNRAGSGREVIFMRTPCLTIALLVLLGGACTPGGGAPEPTRERAAGKADSSFEELTRPSRRVAVEDISSDYVPPPDRLASATQRLISSEDAWRRYFGADEDPPAHIDFEREWVVFAASGTKTSGGYRTEVKVRIHPETGDSLRARVVTHGPGRGCAVSSMLTHPYFLGTIPAGDGIADGIRPQDIRYAAQTTAEPCEATCDGAVTAALERARIFEGEEVLAASESDYPYHVVSLGPAPDEIDVAHVARAALESGVLDEFLDEQREHDPQFPDDKEQVLARLLDDEQGNHIGFDSFSSSERDFFDWSHVRGGYDVARAEWNRWSRTRFLGHRQLTDALRRHLSDIQVVLLFDVQVQVFIVGRTACGELAGYHTQLVWT
jgi:hypothetical protein